MLSFQEIILKLQEFWAKRGCLILQPYDVEMGAGTFHPATALRALGSSKWNVAFVQPSRRPTDSRFAEHPNRLQHYYQFQVILKPNPPNSQELYLDSLKYIGIDIKQHDIRFVEDDWESPTLGACGLGWEVWIDGMEVSQFTYMQQIGEVRCKVVPLEITYGPERLALYIQGVDNFQDIMWNEEYSYADVEFEAERQFSYFNLKHANVDFLLHSFQEFEGQCSSLIDLDLPLPAYDFCIKASHAFNLLDSRGVISHMERASYISKVRNLAKKCCQKWVELTNNNL